MELRNFYLIEYAVFSSWNTCLKRGKIKVKNKMNEFDAKTSLERYLKKKVVDFKRLEIYSCRETSPLMEMLGCQFKF